MVCVRAHADSQTSATGQSRSHRTSLVESMPPARRGRQRELPQIGAGAVGVRDRMLRFPAHRDGNDPASGKT